MRCFTFLLIAFGSSLVSALPYHGADFSSLLLLESTTDIQYAASSNAAPQPFEQILYDYGVNLARIRIWTAGTYNLTYGLELAKRAKAAGMDLLIDLHYDDTCNVPRITGPCDELIIVKCRGGRWTPGYPFGLAYRPRRTCVSSFQVCLHSHQQAYAQSFTIISNASISSSYTYDLVQAFNAQGTTIQFIQV